MTNRAHGKPGTALKTAGRWLGVAAVIALMMLMWNSPLLWPLKIFVVLLHELSHVAAIVLTGGHPTGISLSANQGGLAQGVGGNAFIVLNAGYVGSLAWGLLLLAIANRRRAVSWSMRAMGIGLGLATLVWMRPVISFGFLYGLAAALLLFVVGWRLPASVGAGLLRVLGIFSCLYALVDIQLDVLHPASWGRTSDASMLAESTHVPALVWGVGWTLLSLAILVAFRKTVIGGSR